MRELKKGDRVYLKGKHPWAGEIAVYVSDRKTHYGIRPVVRLESGDRECFVMHPDRDMQLLEQ